MQMLFKIIFFGLALNLAAGFIQNALPGFGSTYMGGVPYIGNYTGDFVTTMNTNISPSGLVENKGNALFRVLDMITIGWFNKITKVVDQYLYGFISVMSTMTSTMLDPTFHQWLFGILYTVMSILYGIGLFYLWTGRNIVE